MHRPREVVALRSREQNVLLRVVEVLKRQTLHVLPKRGLSWLLGVCLEWALVVLEPRDEGNVTERPAGTHSVEHVAEHVAVDNAVLRLRVPAGPCAVERVGEVLIAERL